MAIEIPIVSALATNQTGGVWVGPDGQPWTFIRQDGGWAYYSGNTRLPNFSSGAPMTKDVIVRDGESYTFTTSYPPQGKDNLMSFPGANMVPVTLKYDNATKSAMILCSNYTVDGGRGTIPKYMTSGPWAAFDGSYQYVGTTKTRMADGKTTSTISVVYTLGTVVDATKSTCDLRTTLTTDRDIVKLVKLPNSRFTVELMDAPVSYANTEVGVIEVNGSYTQLVKPNGLVMALDWMASHAFVTYVANSKSYGVTIDEKGNTNEVFNSETANLLRASICVSSFLGNTALLCGSSRLTNGYADELVMLNTKTSKNTVLSSYSNGDLNGVTQNYVHPGNAVVDENGTVCFQTYNATDKSIRMWKYTAPGPVKITKFISDVSTIYSGTSTTLRWTTNNAKTVNINGLGVNGGLGFVQTSGNIEVSPSGNWIYSMTAVGDDGSFDHAEVRINVTPSVVRPIISGVVNAASMDSTLAPGTLGTIFGTDLCYGQASSSTTLPLPTSLCDGTMVLIDGKAVPLTYVGAGQINFLFPPDVSLGIRTVQVVRGTTVMGPPATVTLTATAPGVFMNGRLGILTDASTNQLVTADNPMVPGQFYVTWLTGLGLTDCPIKSGDASNAICNALAKTTLTIDGLPAQILYAGLQPTFPGLYQVNFVAPGTTDNSSSSREVTGILSAGDMQTSFTTVSQVVQ